jgi:hypothetical protein
VRNPARRNPKNPDGVTLFRPPGTADPSDQPLPPVKKAVPPLTLSGLTRALGVTERDLETFQPNEHHLKVGEAFLAGHSSMDAICTYTGLERDEVREVLNSSIAMQWISRRTEALFRSRVAIIDCSLYLRAAAGDMRAIELYYKRMKLLEEATKKVEVNYSGGINLTAVTDDELARIVHDKTKLLPAEFKLIEDKKSADTDPPK